MFAVRRIREHILLLKSVRLDLERPNLAAVHVLVHPYVETTRPLHDVVVDVHQPFILQTPQVDVCFVFLEFIQTHDETLPFGLHQIDSLGLQLD